jgi:anaerobic magnesium-protoporphyrin IX monomethyl ester cyclase
MKILFVEPPKDFWFVMGEYTPPPLGILQLAAFLESRMPNIEIDVLDCQAELIGWDDLKRRIESYEPNVVVSSALASFYFYVVSLLLHRQQLSCVNYPLFPVSWI